MVLSEKQKEKCPGTLRKSFSILKTLRLAFQLLWEEKHLKLLGKPLKGRLNIVVSKNKSYKTVL